MAKLAINLSTKKTKIDNQKNKDIINSMCVPHPAKFIVVQ